jgi:histone H3/H4
MAKRYTTSAKHAKHRPNARMRRRLRLLQKDMTRLQQSDQVIIPYVSFSRLVRELLAEHGEFSIRATAMKALQIATEDRVTEIFKDAARLANYQKRETVTSSDIKFIVPKHERQLPATTSAEGSVPPPCEPAQ